MYNIPANNNLGTTGNAAAGYCDTEMNCTADSIAPYKESMFWNIIYSYRKYNNESSTIRNDICKEMKIMQMDVLDYQVEVYLPTSVTEECANLDCYADFLWIADEVIDEEGNEGKLVSIVNTGVSDVIHKVVNNNCFFYPLMLLILLAIYLLSRISKHEDE